MIHLMMCYRTNLDMFCCQGEMDGKIGQGYAALLVWCGSWTVCLGGLGFLWRLCVLGEAECLQE